MKDLLVKYKALAEMRMVLLRALLNDNEVLRRKLRDLEVANLALSDEVINLRNENKPWWLHQDKALSNEETKNDVTPLLTHPAP